MGKKNWAKELFRPENKKARMNLFTAFLIGILLLLMNHVFFQLSENQTEIESEQQTKQTEQTEQKQYHIEQEIEKRLEYIFSNMEGVGQVKVMVTMKNTKASVLAKEERKEYSFTEEGQNKKTQSQKEENTIVMTEDNRGTRTPVIVQEKMPEIEGIVIVAEGGEDARIAQMLSEASQALLNVPAHKVAVLKMK